MDDHRKPPARSFSLVRGGPLHQAWRRIGLVRHDRRDALRLAVAALAIAWVPLVAIGAIERLVSGSWPAIVSEPSVQVRLLFGLPLLAIAEPVADMLTRRVTGRLIDEGIVDAGDPGLARAFRSAARLRDSSVVELVLLAAAVTGSGLALGGVGPWQGASQAVAAEQWSAARSWYGFIALPLVQLLTYRWLWRWVVWARLLVSLSRLRLRLEPGHPDGAGGVAQISQASLSFAPLACGLAGVLASAWATRILAGDARLADFVQPLVAFAVVLIALAFGPMMAFTPRLVSCRVQGQHDYGRLVTEYMRGFRQRWIERRTGSELLESSDIQSLADLNEVHRRASRMRVVPFDPTSVTRFAVLTLVPMLPLVLTEIPLGDLLRMIGKLVVGHVD